MTCRHSLWLCAGLALSLWADDVSLVRISDPWRYFQSTNEPSLPLTAWRGVDFDDSAWLVGASGFSKSGDEATFLSPTTAYSAVYFRRRFTVQGPELIQWLVLRADYDDGFVAYLNGVEIARRGLTGDPVPFNAYATEHPRGAIEDIDVSAFARLLRSGTNVLAIQLHPSSSSPWSLVLVPELLGNFTRGPFLGHVSSNFAEIVWHTPVPADGVVEYGTDPTLGSIELDFLFTNRHSVTLTGLTPDTRYYYRVSSSDGQVTAVSPVFSFRTLKPAGDISFVVFGDSGGGYVSQYRVAQLLAAQEADLVLHTGDFIYPSFIRAFADIRLMSVYGPHLRRTPYFGTLGNHDTYYDAGAACLETLHLPTNAVTGTEHFYSFDHGDAHFVSLFVPFGYCSWMYCLNEGSVQHQWLVNDLAQSAKPWKFLFFHVPMHTSGPHAREADGLIPLLLPLARQYGVQAIFNGHDHDYERLAPTNGVHTFVSGGGGRSLYHYSYPEPLGAQFWSAYHCLKVNIHGDTMRVEAISDTGTVLDTAVIHRAPPPAQVWHSAWNSPLVENTPANDGDGNLLGQTFDLIGPPIPAKAGDFSNLGDVFVNNGPGWLYLGFKQTLLGPANHLLLFIESPRLPGVRDVIGFGDGVPAGGGEDVDALDFLENLAFTNFSPAIACVLGDEFADGQFRSWQRGDPNVAPGQGVFRLDFEFTDVPGARVQQFNISPQSPPRPGHESPTHERTADLIEVAIPYAALGGLQPGDSIKIAAVAGGGVDWASQTTDLDHGFLGAALHGSGFGPVLLEGLTVQLADYPPGADTDGDGLLDRWEVENGLDALSATGEDGPAGDPDSDGFTNAQEQFAGTDPRSADSVLSARLTVLSPARCRIAWQAVPGRRYVVQWARDVDGEFADLPSPDFPRTATSTNESYEVEVTALSPHPATLFFRVRVLPSVP